MTSQSTTGPAPPIERQHERLHVEVNIAGEPPVQLEFGPASRLALRERRKIEIREANGLLKLVYPVAGQEDPRHVGLSKHHRLAHTKTIGGGLNEECHFVRKRRRPDRYGHVEAHKTSILIEPTDVSLLLWLARLCG